MVSVGAEQLRSPQWAKKMRWLKAVMLESVQKIARGFLGKRVGRDETDVDIRARLRRKSKEVLTGYRQNLEYTLSKYGYIGEG